ncbi:MAG TPA: RodZ domain-containing protein [Candidatus Baltobacteraceae bacterium]|jgi:transcriptional regulator with XRE-family HTH domain|nr:RodZ domain-containing protein [Candidatus Baltobacteraceae bacterium]
MSLGERFRAAREQRGQTLSEAAEYLRIRSVYLAAIEDENWSAIGAPVYTRGFLRTYARHLGLDPEEAVAEYNQATGAATAAPQPSPLISSRGEPHSLRPLLWIAGAVALGLVGFVIYLYVSAPGGAGRVAAGGGPAAMASRPASPRPARPAPTLLPQTQTLAIRLTAPSWLRVTVDGNVNIEGTFPAGTTRTFHGKSALVRVGNAGGVHITVDGKTVGTLGGPGDVAERSFAL